MKITLKPELCYDDSVFEIRENDHQERSHIRCKDFYFENCEYMLFGRTGIKNINICQLIAVKDTNLNFFRP